MEIKAINCSKIESSELLKVYVIFILLQRYEVERQTEMQNFPQKLKSKSNLK